MFKNFTIGIKTKKFFKIIFLGRGNAANNKFLYLRHSFFAERIETLYFTDQYFFFINNIFVVFVK